MKKLTKTLLISGMAALAFGSVAAGTTYALFTSEAKNDVTITVGKVSVSTKVELVEAYHPAGIDADGTISDSTNDVANSDLKVDIAEDGKVSIGKMLPGDKVTLKVTPTNDSDVKIKYRETYEVVGNKVEGADLLKITGDEDMVKNWTVLEAGGEIDAYEVVIELPATETKRVDEVTIKLGLEAVQGNAVVYDVAVSDEESLEAALDSDEEFVSIKLNNDIDLAGSYLEGIKGNTTIYGDGTTKIIAKEAGMAAINMDSDDTEINKNSPVVLTLVGLDIVGPTADCGSNDANRGISAWGNKDLTMILDNCTVSANHYALNIAAANEKTKVVIRNSTLTGYSAFQTWSENTNATFENCTLIGSNKYEGDDNGYATIVLCPTAKNANLSFVRCNIEINHKTSDKASTQKFVSVQAESVTKYAENAILSFKGCAFFENGAEVTITDENKTTYFNCQGDTTLTIE